MTVLIVLVVLLCIYVLLFEFSNGFHDTANAVATVIYTRSMKPRLAVLRSGLWNMIGVLVGWLAVAYSIVNLFPLTELIGVSVIQRTSFFLSLLLTAIWWNIYTRWRGIPSSSMHALIWSIIGVSLAFSLHWTLPFGEIPWIELQDVALSLLISPLIGFWGSFLVVRGMKKFFPKIKIFWKAPTQNKTPPLSIKATQILACTAVSFAHGSNDGQKGIWLMLALLIAFFPAVYWLDHMPWWIVWVVAATLWLWTLIGWKRVVDTIGKWIGKHPMTFWEWATAEMVAAVTIGASSFIWLPVSTTHVVSSGVAWSAAWTAGMKWLQKGTISSILTAWLLTLPVTMIIWFALYFVSIRYAALF